MRAIVIDDETDCNGLYKVIIERAGFTVVGTALNGKTGYQLLADLKPDLALLDLRMPGMDGYELMRQVRANNVAADTKIIVVTAASLSQDQRRELITLGVEAILSKPFNPRELIKLVTDLFQTAK